MSSNENCFSSKGTAREEQSKWGGLEEMDRTSTSDMSDLTGAWRTLRQSSNVNE